MDALAPPGMAPPDPAMMAMQPPPEAPPDPAGGQFYELLLQAQEMLEAEWNQKNEPMYPPWYDEKDYPKPTSGKMKEIATNLENEFAGLRTRIREDYAIVAMDVAGIFHSDFENPDVEDKWYDSGIQSEVEIEVATIADSEISFDAPARKRSEEDESAKKVDFAIATLEDAKRHHSRDGGGPIRVEKAKVLLTTGRVAWHTMWNPNADVDEMPYLERLVDPATCYPVFENHRGMRIMVRTYNTRLGDAVSSFDTVDRDLYNEYFNSRDKGGQFKKVKKESEACTVTEYWDRRWRAIFIDDVLVLGPVEHKFGFVPFVYKMSGRGMPSYLKDPSTASARDLSGFTFMDAFSARDVAMPHKGIGLVRLLKVPHQFREALLTKMLTAFEKSVDPPIAIEIDDITYSKGVPPISRAKSAVSPLRMNRQQIKEIPTGPDLSILQPLMGAAEDARARMMYPQAAHGENRHSNVAGYATNLQMNAGQIKSVPEIQALEEFEQDCMELRFALYRDWGHLIKQGRDGTYGELMVPRTDAMPDQDQMFMLTPGDLRRTGIKITVSLSNLPLSMLGPTGQAVNILMGAGLLDEIGAMKLLKYPNPYKALARIQMNKALNDPALQEIKILRGMMQEGMVGEAAYFMMQKAAKQQQGAMMPPEMGGGIGTTVGDSAAQMGMGPGPGSGPPLESLPPPQFDYGNEP